MMNAKPGHLVAEGAEWVAKASARLGDLARLPENWDGQGSPRIDPAILDAADSLLARVCGGTGGDLPCPDVCPIPGGTLQFEWTLGRKHLEIEFVEADRVVVLKEESTRDGLVMDTEELPLSRTDRIVKLLDWLGSRSEAGCDWRGL